MEYSHTAYVSLGSNLESEWGGPESNLGRALELLAAGSGLKVDAVSPVYLTEPQNLKEQPWFANQVVRLHCGPALTSFPLLARLHEIEAAMGRRRAHAGENGGGAARYGPRVIDLDILLFDDEKQETPELTLPHPRLAERAFVLVPLQDIEPDLIIPGRERGSRTLRELLGTLSYRLERNRIYQ